jgi:hypothetical protein
VCIWHQEVDFESFDVGSGFQETQTPFVQLSQSNFHRQ